MKEETIWSLQQLQEYMSRNNIPVPPDWVATALTVWSQRMNQSQLIMTYSILRFISLTRFTCILQKRMKDIMLYCFQSVRFKLQSRLGYFDLLGFDFMMDESLNVSSLVVVSQFRLKS